MVSVVRTICDRRAGERGGGPPAAQDSQEGAGQGGRRRRSLHSRSRNTSLPNGTCRLSIQTADYKSGSGSGAFLTPGSGMKKTGSGSAILIRDPDPG